MKDTPTPDTHIGPTPTTRRHVLKRLGQAAGLSALAGFGGWALHDPTGKRGLPNYEPIHLRDYFAGIDFPSTQPRISACFGSEHEIERMVGAAVGGLDSMGFKRFVGPGDVVLLKPNVGFDRPSALGATTNPAIVAAVAKLCLDAGADQVLVADNPIESPQACFTKSGIGPAARAAGATVLLHRERDDFPLQIRKDRPDPAQGEVLGTWPIFWSPLRKATKVIGLPVVKDHNLCSASMAMKNWYGLLSGRRNQFHQAIHPVISDLALMMHPTLVIADGTRVMMRNGPTGGKLDDVRTGGITGRAVVIASVDQVSLDGWCYQNLLGRDPAQLSYLELAYRKTAELPDRLVAPSWQDYKAQGMIVETTLPTTSGHG